MTGASGLRRQCCARTSMEAISRVGLGTAQFGQPYGVANTAGQVPCREGADILAFGRAAGMDTVDTAVAYGDSERRLGRAGVKEWKVVSKLPPTPALVDDLGKWVRETVRGSLDRLGVSRLHGLLLHRSSELLSPRGTELYNELLGLKDRGMVDKIGVSVYGPDELAALGIRYQFDIVQAPYNVFDRRMVDSGWLARLRSAGTEVHTRSAFLQGLLLMNADRRPEFFSRWDSLLAMWDLWLAQERLTPVAACLNLVLAEPAVTRVIVGVESVTQLQEVLTAAEFSCPTPPDNLKSRDPDLLNPSRWSVS